MRATPEEHGHRDGKKKKPLRLLRAGAAGTAGLAVAAVAALSAQSASGGPVKATISATPHNVGHDVGTTTTTTPPRPVPTVVAVSPGPGVQDVALGSTVKVLLSSVPQHGAPMPTLVPPVAGRWSVSGTELTFVPSAQLEPWRTETLTVPPALAVPRLVSPPHPSGPPATAFTPPAPAPSAKLAAFQSSFTVAGVSVTREQQLLAELHYLPLRWRPAGGSPALGAEARAPDAVSTAARPGTFSWRYPNVPASLVADWAPGQYNMVMRGAVMAFESDHGLTADGFVGPQVWAALTEAVAHREIGPAHYDYLMVSESLPERLVVWQDGSDVYQAPANTGVPGAATATGTYPVYERFQTTTMAGTDVDGTHYDVQGVPWVAYFNGGDAVHGYWRSAFGYPQSNGCVELPISDAAVVWKMDPVGTLVYVGQ